MKALSYLVNKVSEPCIRQRGFVSAGLIRDWSLIVGDILAQHTQPERISFAHRGNVQNENQKKKARGTLFLRVDSGSFAIELQYLSPLLCEKINTYFGYPAIQTIKIVQAPLHSSC